MKILSVLLCAFVLLSTTSCTRKINPNIYKAGAVGEASTTYRGVVIGTRTVQVDETEHFGENTTGGAVGAIGGGLIGSQIGGGTTAPIIGALAGALAGGLGGAYLQEQMGSQAGIEYTVELTSGKIMTVVQGPENVYAVGQPVLVIVSKKGRSRIVPDQTGGKSYAKSKKK